MKFVYCNNLFPIDGVKNFEVKLAFLSSRFSTWPIKSGQERKGLSKWNRKRFSAF